MTSVGAGYVIVDSKEPDITIKATLGRYHVCQRRTDTWKEIIAEFSHEPHALLFVKSLDPASRENVAVGTVTITMPTEHAVWAKRALSAYMKSLEPSVPVVAEIRQWYERVAEAVRHFEVV